MARIKDMSEHEELLSDIGGIHDIQTSEINEDPFIENDIIYSKDERSLMLMDEMDSMSMDDINNLSNNTFSIPFYASTINCGISWIFENENKLIDLDLIITALDTYSFEMDTINKNNTKIFEKSILYNKTKNQNNDKLIDFKLDSIPSNCYSLWFIIHAYNGDSLKYIHKAIFKIYSCSDDVQNNINENIIYSYDIGMGFDCGAMLLGCLYRNAKDNKQWDWTIIEEKNLYSNLIINNLNLIYDDKIISERPNDKNIKYEFTKCNEKYILDMNINKLQVCVGWDLNTNINMVIDNIKPQQKLIDCMDIDVDVSVIVYGKEENELQQIDIVNNNNNFYKSYVQYINNENININDNNNDDENIDNDEQIFDMYINKMNNDNDINAMCIVLNIFNDNNSKNKTNNITNCYVKLMDEKKELCVYKLSNINDDRNTCALVLGYFKRLENECWMLYTNDISLKTNSSLEYTQYAKEIVLGKYENVINKDACCIIL